MKLFGFEFKKKSSDDNLTRVSAPIPDGSVDIEDINSSNYDNAANNRQTFLEFDLISKTESDLIQKYRDIAQLSAVEDAIDEIVNEAIVVQDQKKIIEIILGKTEFSENVNKLIIDEFDYLLLLLDFHDNGDQIFRQWYIDGRHYYHKVIENNKESEGIQELNWLDPKKTLKIREFERKKIDNNIIGSEISVVKREYFLFNPNIDEKKKIAGQVSFSSNGRYENRLELSPDSVAYTTSGIIDHDMGIVQSYLHPALKPANQLSLLEDSAVVYRLVRAPERRIFYIDVGTLPPGRAEQHVARQMAKYKNKLIYDVNTGKIDAAKAHISMQEDFWLPRREGGRSTEVTTLTSTANLGAIEEITYFKRGLAQALNIPISRLDSESTFNLGISGEIKRDELKFSKFVDKIRRRFNTFFYDILETQLILKKIITLEEWEENKHHIQFQYNRDSYISELQNAEMWKQRFELLEAASAYTGKDKYLSIRWNYENILNISDEEKAQIQKDWEDEPNITPIDVDGLPPESFALDTSPETEEPDIENNE